MLKKLKTLDKERELGYGLRGVPVAHLVREAISMLLEQDTHARLQAAEELFKVEAPVANWEEMKREIEEGRLRAKQP